ncbi:hypothetical protein JCM8097_006922 [Rhodosporidiobolus ruineniae]
MPSRTVFLLGAGFVGGSVLQALLEDGSYAISVLNRDPEKADKLKELGVRPVEGSLHDDEVTSREAAQADIVLHIATADDLPSVQSILKGLEQRDQSKPPAIYIHTSGTGVFMRPLHPEHVVFSDKDPAQWDELVPGDAPHRQIDLTIKRAAESGKLNAKISIMLPPLIYGTGNGPFNQHSIQIPRWIAQSVKNKQVTIAGPTLTWNSIHVLDLVPAYLTALSYLSSLPSSARPPIYLVPSTGEHTWRSLGQRLDAELKKRGLIDPAAEVKEQDEPDWTTLTGTRSRARGEWLSEWGWKRDESLPDVHGSVAEEIDHIKATGQI